jgi:hypothetical protein
MGASFMSNLGSEFSRVKRTEKNGIAIATAVRFHAGSSRCSIPSAPWLLHGGFFSR